jgi:hypothetical protein
MWVKLTACGALVLKKDPEEEIEILATVGNASTECQSVFRVNSAYTVSRGIPLNVWTHVAATFKSKTNALLYINGEYDPYFLIVRPDVQFTATDFEAHEEALFGLVGEGLFDDVKLFASALDLSDIVRDMSFQDHVRKLSNRSN